MGVAFDAGVVVSSMGIPRGSEGEWTPGQTAVMAQRKPDWMRSRAAGVSASKLQGRRPASCSTAGQAEAVGIFDPHAIDGDDFGGASKFAGGLELVDEGEGLAFGHLDVEFRRAGRVGRPMSTGSCQRPGPGFRAGGPRVETVVEAVPAFL